MCQKAVNAYLLTVRFVTDWFATPKCLKIFIIIYSLIIRTLNIIITTLMTLMLTLMMTLVVLVLSLFHGSINTISEKNIKKRLMPIPWLPTRVWDWCMSEDEKRDRISD